MLLHVGYGEFRSIQKTSTLCEAILANDIGCKAVKRVTEWHDFPNFSVILHLLTQFVDCGRNNGL